MQNRARSSTRDDFDKVKQALHKLKTENRKLRKDNAKLRKELNRADEYEFDRKVEAEDEETGPVEYQEEKAPECPKCKSGDFNEIRAGKYLIKACKSCGYRKRSQVKE